MENTEIIRSVSGRVLIVRPCLGLWPGETIERNAAAEFQRISWSMRSSLVKGIETGFRNRESSSSGNKTLVVVGAAHLVGREGVVELLRQKGYSVEQL